MKQHHYMTPHHSMSQFYFVAQCNFVAQSCFMALHSFVASCNLIAPHCFRALYCSWQQALLCHSAVLWWHMVVFCSTLFRSVAPFSGGHAILWLTQFVVPHCFGKASGKGMAPGNMATEKGTVPGSVRVPGNATVLGNGILLQNGTAQWSATKL